VWIDSFLIAVVVWLSILLSQIFYIGIGLLGGGFVCVLLSYCYECICGGYVERDCVSLNGMSEMNVWKGSGRRSNMV
jgi:hypothetical protein